MGPLVIVNPHAGGGRAGRTFNGVRAVLERSLGPLDVAFSAKPDHCTGLARQAVVDGRSLVIAVGGDGTLSEVANGVLEAGGGAAVGYVGQGTGGDFARTLGLEHRLDCYVDAIARGKDRFIDVGKVRYCSLEGEPRTRWFINILSAGLGGLVDRHVAGSRRVFGAKATYFLASMRALAECERARLVCNSSLGKEDASHRLDAYMIAICNGGYFGGGMHVAPMAEPDDGRLEVVAMNAPSKLAFAGFSRQIYTGSHLASPGVRHFACDRIRIDLENDQARNVFLLDVDGEPLGVLPVDVELVPRALKFRCSQSFGR
jgi:YegS/Rv2252/BmrU family lipid kinase